MQFAIDIALSLIYFALFLLLCAWSWKFWTMYVNQKHLNELKWMMLEIKLPREIFKSPYATEVAISSLLQGGGIGNKYARYFKGALPVYSSLEIASIEGTIHFYVRIQTKFRSLVESNFYAQYPGIEIVEADDYTKLIRYHHLSKDVSMWGETYTLKETWVPWDWEEGGKYMKDGKPYKMPADFFPIKTYKDYGLDKDPKEEFKIDPITPLLEFMGSVGKGEYLWYQIILQDEGVYDGRRMPYFYVNEVAHHEHVSLKKMADTYKRELRIEGFNPKGSVIKETVSVDNDGNPIMKKGLSEKPTAITRKETDLTAEDKRDIEAINNKLAKPLAVVVMRLMYLTDNRKTTFNPENIQNILAFPKPFTSDKNTLGFKKVSDPYDYPWQNFQGRRVPWRSEEMFEAYVEREGFYPHIEERKGLDSWEDSIFWSSSMQARKTWRMFYEAIFHPFHHPRADEAFTLNLEEIATLWHLPGAVATTPTLPRIDSAKGVAPVNLPH